MTSAQNSAELLLSLASQIENAPSATAWDDLYLLARKIFWAEMDATETSRIANAELRSDLRIAFRAVQAAVEVWTKSNPPRVVGLVTFSDGSSYGGRK